MRAPASFISSWPANWKRKTFTHIEVMDAIDAIKKFGKEVEFIIMSWPPYNEPIAYEVLKTMREVNPNLKLIFIGEDYGGCTADDNFFDNVKEIEDKEIINHLDYINNNLFKNLSIFSVLLAFVILISSRSNRNTKMLKFLFGCHIIEDFHRSIIDPIFNIRDLLF